MSHCLIKIYTDCIVKRGHSTKMSETENSQLFFNLVPALTRFGDISLQFRSSFSCIHLCENMRRVDITREEIVAGQIVYLSEHEIKALNWKTGLKRKSRKKSVDVHIKKDLGQQTLPLSQLSKVTLLLLPSMYPCYPSFLKEFNMQQVYCMVVHCWIKFNIHLSGAGFSPAESPEGIFLLIFLWFCVEYGSKDIQLCWFWLLIKARNSMFHLR